MAYGIVFDPTKSVPTDGNLNAKPTDFATKFVVAFDVAPVISDAGGTAVIYKNGGLFKTFPVTKTSSSVVVVGKTLEITHGITSFTQSDIYSVAITDGAITGLAAGALANGVYDFTIGDYVAPVLSSTAASYAPLKGATSVMANLDGSAFALTIPFSETVAKPATPGNKAVYIYKEDGTVIDIVKVSSAAVTIAGSNVTVPIASTAIFQENTKYYVSIDAGAFEDASPNKNAFGGLSNVTTWTFTTRDYSAPAITATVTDITTSAAKLNVTLTEKGKYYYLLQTAATADPANAAAVQAGGVAVTVANANTVVTSNLALAGSTDYEVFVVSENNEAVSPNLSTAVVKKTFSSIDNTAPLSIARGVINNSAKRTTGVYMVFNEQVKGGAGTLDLRLTSNEAYVKQIGANEITSVQLTTAAEVAKYPGSALNDWVTVVDFGMTLPSNVGYYIVFPSGYLKDNSDNVFVGGAFANPINKGDWGFTSSDFELPTVTVAFATPASLNSDINVTFNETVTKQLTTTTDWAQVLALELNNVAVPFTVTSPLAAANGTVIVIDPSVTLAANTTYTVRLRQDAVKDLNNNAIVTENVYTVTTGDLDAFAVQYGSSLGATVTTNLLGTSTLKIDFNKAIKVNTTGTTWVDATAANLTPLIAFKKGGVAKTFTVSYDATTFTATVTPTDPLVSFATDYTLDFDGTKVRDSQSTVLTAVTTPYTVKDYNAPVAANSHSGDMPNSGAPLTITFTDDNLGSLADLGGTALTALTTAQLEDHITFKEGSSNGPNLAFTVASYAGGVITITPTVALANDKTYYYGIGASVKDAAGNVTEGKFTTFKMVAPTVAPTIVANTYTVNGSAQTPVADKLVNIVPKTGNIVTVTVTFNDNIKETQSVPIYNTVSLTDGVGTWFANVTPTNVSGNTLTVDFSVGGPLATEALCTLTLPAGIVRGSTAYDNTTVPPSFAAFAGKSIQFNSKDIVVPVITANTPAAAATGVALNTALKIDFSEKVELGTGNILIKKGATTEQTIAVNSSNVTLNATGNQATIVKANLLDYNTVYTVEVPAGAFKDDISANGNALTSFTFTTDVNPQPTTTTLSPADNSDQVALSPLSLGMTFNEEVVKYNPLVGTRKLWYLIKEGNAGIRASFNPVTLDLQLNAGNDVVVANDYIEFSSVGISGNSVTISTGYTPVANERYYVLITPGAFVDKSTGVGVGANPVPGVFAGVTTATDWNFTTKDENPGAVTFTYTKRADNKVAKESNITINFSRPIKKADGSAINDVDIANLFVLNKTAGPGTLGVKAFIGSISADKKTVTVLNSSLVTLGEMTELSSYTIGMVGGSMIYQNGAAIAGAFDAFTTSDYTAPVVTPSITAAIADVKKDEATIQFNVTDNMNLATLYYTIQAGDNTTPTPAADVVKTGMSKAIVGASPQAASYKFTGLTEETSYVVWTCAVDEAGNTSAVSKLVFITDDATKPMLVTKPTSFDAAGKLTFVFNEDVSPAAASVRILDASSMKELAVIGLNAVPTKPKELITDAFAPAITNTLVNYYVEIDKGLVGDVPVVAGDAINYFDGLFRTDLMVTSKDVTLPAWVSSSPAAGAVSVNNTFSLTLTFTEAVKKVGTLPANAFVVEKETAPGSGVYEPFEVVDPANVVTNDTKDVVINVSRMLASSTKYQVSVNLASFEDLSGNDHAAGTFVGTFTAKDILAPVATFTPAKNLTGVAVGTTTLTIAFNEAIRNLDNTAIDSYDLDSLVYVKKDGVDIAFDAVMTTTSLVTITIPAVAVDQTYTFGFKAKFEDVSNNVVIADAATFKTVTTTPAAQYLTWAPAKKSPFVAPWPWLASTGTVTMNFNAPIYTYSTVAADNNLIVTPANIVTLGIVTVKQNGITLVANTDYVLSTPDNKTIVVTPKTNWVSSSLVEVIINGATLQYAVEGNVTILGTAGVPFDQSNYTAEDIIDPIVDITYGAAGFTAGYYPAMVGLAGVSPVIAKTESLKLYFDEDVKAGTATVEIRRWDGVLAKPAMLATVAADKRTVTLGDLTDLVTNQEYYAIVNPGVVVDVTDNNPYAGITAVKVWKFLLKDDAIPQVVSYMPNTSNQSVNTALTINLDRPVALTGKGYVALYKSAAGGDAVQIWRGADNGTTGAFTISGNTVTVNIAIPLEANTQYFVELADNTLWSTADNTKVNAGIARSVWSFTTEVNAAPALVAGTQVPAHLSNGITLDQDLEMTFNMPVEAGSGNIQLHAADGSLVLNFDVKGTDVTFAGDVVKVALPTLAESKEYYVIVPATAVRNVTYTPEYFGGITVPYNWKFNTGDFTAPTVTATPATGEAMAMTFDVTLTFNEKVTGVTASALTVSNGVINTVSTEPTGTVYVVNITAPSKSEVTLTVPETVKDVAGNALVEVDFGPYKVDNFDAPKLIGWTPADGSIGLSKDTSLVMTFDKVIVPGTGKINIYNSLNELFKTYTVEASNVSADGKVVTIPVTGLADETTYVVTFEEGMVKDLLAKPIAALIDPTVWNFTVGDNTAPTVVSITPAISNNAANSFDVTIEFSEDVLHVAENITVDNGTVVVTGSGSTYVATIEGADGDVIVMTIATGVMDAEMRNSLATAVTKTYKIGDNTAPTVVVTPPAEPVATVFTVGLKFNEVVSGVATGVTVTGGTLTDVTGSGDTYTLTISAKEQTKVTINLTDGIKDMSPNTNKFAGETLEYTTGDFTSPELLSWTPNNETTEDNHPTFTLTFNENVALGAGGSLKIYKVSTTTAVLDIPITAAMVNGKTVTVSYEKTQNGLDKNTRYYVLVDGAALTDVAGNKFAGVSNIADWTFKTGANFATKIDPNASLEFKVYPNPFVDYVNIGNASMLSKVVVTNIAGQVVKEVVNPTDRIQLNELRSGIYFISLYNEGTVIKSAKIVKR